MPRSLLVCSRLRHARLACAAAALLAPALLLSQTLLCTITFADPAATVVLDAQAKSCLNQAAAQFYSHSGTGIVLSGSSAARVATSRQYLLSVTSLPLSSVFATITPGDPRLVKVAFVLQSQQDTHNTSIQPPPRPLPSASNDLRHHRAAPTPQPQPASEHTPPDVSQQATLPGPPPPTVQPLPPPNQTAPPAHASSGGSAPTPPHSSSPTTGQHQPLTAKPAHAAQDQSPPVYPAGDAVQKWENQLKSGGIEFNSPQSMVAGASTGVVVIIHGYADKEHSDLPGIQQQGTVKVSDFMRVDLDAPFAPGEFTIKPTQGAKLPVPVDGSAMWEFQVSPKDGSPDPQTLVIHPYLYPPNKLDAQPLQERNFTVTVTVESLWHHLVRLWHEDPIKVLKYLLPGGKGWSGLGAFLTGLIALLTSLGVIAWIRRKINPHEAAPKDSKT